MNGYNSRNFFLCRIEQIMTTKLIKRALLSVSDKTGIVEFAKELIALGVDIISTGGTSAMLKNANIAHHPIEEMTGLPEMLDGRVKTLHPKIHGGILGRRDEHASEADQYGIQWIDLVIVNFYPFQQVVEQTALNWDEAVQYIDIGGPTLVRAAAKNFAWVSVVVDPEDYESLLVELRRDGGLEFNRRKQLAEKAFALTARYDAMIHHYFLERNSHEKTVCPSHLDLQFEKLVELRYGENPHQKACAYQFRNEKTGVMAAAQYQGKPLSYNNILDAEAASTCVAEFAAPAAVIVKHANPCGAATALTIDAAFTSAYQSDPLSAFGGILALNRPCTKVIAEATINKIFLSGFACKNGKASCKAAVAP